MRTSLPSAPAAQPARRVDFGAVLSVLLLAFGAIGILLPFLWMFATSLRSQAHAYDLPPSFLPTEFVWENYAKAIFGDVPLLLNLANSAAIAIAVTLVQILIAPLAGYAFARFRFPGRDAIFVVLLTGLMVPIQVTIIPLFVIIRQLGLVNTILSVVLVTVTNVLGVFLMRQFFLGVPQEIFDASRVDGAGWWATYRHIALPMVKNAVSTLGVVVFLASWNAYYAPSILLTRLETTTLPVGIAAMAATTGAGPTVPVLMAATTIAIVPALTVFLIAQRWIIQSLTSSAVKG